MNYFTQVYWLFVCLCLAQIAKSDLIGNIQGQLRVDQGKLSYNLPLSLPLSIHSLSPELSINYHQMGNASLLGMGFVLSASDQITRCSANIEKDGFNAGIELNENARFCHNGEKLVLTSGERGESSGIYRKFIDDNTKYESHETVNYTPKYFKVRTPDGFVSIYTKINGHSDIHTSWLLSSRKDIFGNTISYQYSDDAVPLLESIQYPGYNVQFHYKSRSFPVTQYQAGVKYSLSKLLDFITVHHNEALLYSYRFSYESMQTKIQFDRLKEVTQCYPDGECLKPISFDYAEMPNPDYVLDRAQDRTIVIPKDHYYEDGQKANVGFAYRPSYQSGDLNNDGYPDFCYYRPAEGLLCTLHNGNESSYSELSSWSEDLGFSANADDYAFFSSFQLLDLNNDGFSDYCVTNADGVRCGINNTNGAFLEATLWHAFDSDRIDAKKADFPAFMMVDDDKNPDVCVVEYNNSWKNQGRYTENYRCYKNTGASFSGLIHQLDNQLDGLPPYAPDRLPSGEPNDKTLKALISPVWVDIDGDFDDDLCWMQSNTDASVTFGCVKKSTDPQTRSATFSSFQSLLTIADPATKTVGESELSIFKFSFRLSDVNADGLPDMCYVQKDNEQYNYRCHVNNGSGFNASDSWLDISYLVSLENRLQATLGSIRIEDKNLDGLADLCAIYNQFEHCAYNLSGRFGELTARQNIAADIDVDTSSVSLYLNFVKQVAGRKTSFINVSSSAAFGKLITVSDTNKDGFNENCYRSIEGVVCVTNDNFDDNALLTGITDSYGQRTLIEYGNLLDAGVYQKPQSLPQGFFEKPINMKVVTQVTTDSGVVKDFTPAQNTVSYRYEGYLTNPTTNVQGFFAIELHNNERNTWSRTEFYLDKHLEGLEKSNKDYMAGKLIKHKNNHYRLKSLSSGHKRIELTGSDQTQFDVDGSYLSSESTQYNQLDHLGFPKQVVVNKQQGNDQIITTTNTLYDHGTVPWVVGRPSSQTTITTDGIDASQTRSILYEYENGTLKSQTLEPESPLALKTEYVYDTQGNIEKETKTGSGESRSTQTTFNELGKPLTVTDSLGYKTSFTYDERCAAVKTKTDVLGNVTTNQYDAYCRLKSTDAPDNNDVTKTYEWATAADQPWLAEYPFNYTNPAVYKVTETAKTGLWKTSLFDAQGRLIKSLSSGFSDELTLRVSIVDVVFDRFGRKTATTRPYYMANGIAEKPPWMTVTYDMAGRPSQEQKAGPDGNPLITTYHYDGFTSTTKYADYIKVSTAGIHGKPVKIIENGLEVTYDYYPLGDLKSTNAEGLITTLTYDDRGNKKTQQDASLGLWEYEYNAFGELTKQTDAEEQVTQLFYDALGRKERKVTPEGITQWTYFKAGTAYAGLLEQVTGTDTTKQYTYNTLGLVLSETLTVDNESFVTQFTYDEYSRLKTKTDPNGLTAHYSYGTSGSLDAIAIPQEDFKDFNYENIHEDYTAIVTEIARIAVLIEGLEDIVEEHDREAKKYEALVNEFQSKIDEYDNIHIKRLQEMADHHEMLRDAYNSQRDLAWGGYWHWKNHSTFGNYLHKFHYKGIVNDEHKFEIKYCTDVDRILNATYCNGDWIKGSITIPSTELNPMPGQPSVRHTVDIMTPVIVPKSAMVPIIVNGITIMIPATVNTTEYRDTGNYQPHQVYENTANRFNAMAIQEESLRDHFETMVNQAKATRDGYIQDRDLNKNLENQEYAKINAINEGSEGTEGLKPLQEQHTELTNAQGHYENTMTTLGINPDELDQLASMDQVLDAKNGRLNIWMATFRRADGALQTELYGNGLETKRFYNDAGVIERIRTRSFTDKTLRDIHYTYNARALVKNKVDDQTEGYQTNETFGYDAQGRLTSWDYAQSVTENEVTTDNSLARTYDYDRRGNMTFKTGAGAMHYDALTNRLTSRDHDSATYTYSYDDNGNMLSGDTRTYSWSSFNKVKTIQMNQQTIGFTYDESNQRVKKTGINETTYYVSKGYELIVKTDHQGNVIEKRHRHSVWNGHDVVATYEKVEDVDGSRLDNELTTDKVAYFHRDLIGSGDLITGANMEVITRRFYSPYGESVADLLPPPPKMDALPSDAVTDESGGNYRDLIDAELNLDTNYTLLSEVMKTMNGQLTLTRGFTSHEHIQEVGLIHMNARLYDPVIGRFISADTMIPDNTSPLSFNRYSYVNGNPVTIRDPSGHFGIMAIALASAFFVAAHLGNNPYLQIASTVVLTVVTAGALKPITGPAAASALSSLTVSFLRQGKLTGNDLRNAAIAAASAGVAEGIGGVEDGGKYNWVLKAALHGSTQGVFAALRGDSFSNGMIAGTISSLAGSGMESAGLMEEGMTAAKHVFARTMIATGAAALTSKATGGDVLQGALTGATVHLFNGEGDHGKSESTRLSIDEDSGTVEPVTIVDIVLFGPRLVAATFKGIGSLFSSPFKSSRGLGNPFKNKSSNEIDQMFRSKGFRTKGDAPSEGFGGYVNPKSGRSYHIDPLNWGKYREPNHIDVNRLRSYKGSLGKKKLPYKE